METLKIQWHALSGQWLVQAQGAMRTLEQWAQEQPDLTSVRFILSAQNYSVHWVNLPGISSRHLAKALPFALEESLIEDLSQYVIAPAGSYKKTHRAYVFAADLLDRLLEACELHHIQVREVIPESYLLGMQFQLLRQETGWLISLPGDFEGLVTDQALTPVLESLFAEDTRFDEIRLVGRSLDVLELLKTTLETSFPGQIAQIQTQLQQENELTIPSKPLNLLTGRFAPKAQNIKKPAPWWAPVAGLAAALLLLWTLGFYGQIHSLQSQAKQVQEQSLALYKSLFPGERIRSLERQFQEKLAGTSSSGQVGFVPATYALAKAYREQGLADKVQLISLRYNDRMNEMTVEVKAATLDELQALRQSLENSGLQAEIASANNDKDGVKGRIRIGGQA